MLGSSLAAAEAAGGRAYLWQPVALPVTVPAQFLPERPRLEDAPVVAAVVSDKKTAVDTDAGISEPGKQSVVVISVTKVS